MLKPKLIKWTAVTAVCLLLGLLGCTSGPEANSGNDSTNFPTATLHPVFASGEEFGERLRETRDAETTAEAMDEPSPTPRPSPTDGPPTLIGSTPSAIPGAADSGSGISGDGIQVPVLLYHHIGVPEGGLAAAGYEYFVSPEQFEAQMTYLDQNGYTPIDLYALYDYLNGTAELPANPIILTFDDGYTDLYQNAFPILQAHDYTGTFFMITDFVEDGREGYMTWEMVEEMAAAGMRFETHSRSHPDLRGQTSDFLIWQVLDSQETLTQHIGYTPRFIAYPFGQYDENLGQFLEAYDFWGGLTAESGLEIGLENRFTWPRLYIPADTSIDLFASILAEGQTVNYQPEIVEGTEPTVPLTITVSLSTTQGVITTPALLVFDENLNADWMVRTSPDVHFDFQDEQEAHSGSVALAYSPDEDFGSFFLQVRPNAAVPYLRDDIIGVAFWLYTGSEPLAIDDLALIVTGSNEFPYWLAVDESIDLDEFDPTFEDTRFELGFNRPISASTWIQVILFLDDLAYDTDYMYITGLNLVNNANVSRTFLIDELLFILRGS